MRYYMNEISGQPTGLSDYHAKYFAYELTKRCASDSLEKLSSILSNAQVDLNPHQIEAALFAFKSPLSKGDILADEVGLGKTIESDIIKKIITTSQKVTNFSYISEVNLEKLNEMEVQAISVIASHKEKE